VTRFESAVEKLAQEQSQIGATGPVGAASASPGAFDGKKADDDSPAQQHKKRSPIFSLFDNEIVGLGLSPTTNAVTDTTQLHQTGALEAYDNEFSSQIKFPSSNLSDRDKLLSTVVNVPDVLNVLHFASDW